MPGQYDPTNYTLPQQPLHRCMFPLSSVYPTLHLVSNPYQADIDGVRYDQCMLSQAPLRICLLLHVSAFLKDFLEHLVRMSLTFRSTAAWTVISKSWKKCYSSDTWLQQLLIPLVSLTSWHRNLLPQSSLGVAHTLQPRSLEAGCNFQKKRSYYNWYTLQWNKHVI